MLTKKQIWSLTEYSVKKLHINSENKAKRINQKLQNYGLEIRVTPETLIDFYENVIPSFWKKLKRERFLKSQSGELDTALTPLRLSKTEFEEVIFPEIGKWYHLTWAFKGAKFKLLRIDGENGIVWTGETKNKELSIKLSELRHLH